MVENFKFYKSIHEMVKNLNDKKYSSFMKEVCLVQFYEKHIDHVVFNDELLSAIWGGAKVQIKKQLDGYCSIKKLRYDDMFEGAYQGATEGAYQQPQSKPQSKSKPQPQPQYIEVVQKWIDYRISIKKPLSEHSIKAIVKKHSVDAVLFETSVTNSIENGYQGLFEPKVKREEKKGEITHSSTMRMVDKYFADKNEGETIDAEFSQIHN